MVEAAPLQRVVDFARAVGRHHDDRRVLGADGADLRHRHLVVGEHFQQERLERLVRPVELVDQKDRRAGDVGLQRLQDRPLDEEAVGKNVLRQRLAVDVADRFREPDLHHLRRIVPLVDGGGDVEPLVALQPDQPPPERLRQDLGDLRLADARLPFEKQRPPHLEREEQHGGKRPVGDVAGRGHEFERVVDGGREGTVRHGSGRLRRRGLYRRGRDKPHAGISGPGIAPHGAAGRTASGNSRRDAPSVLQECLPELVDVTHDANVRLSSFDPEPEGGYTDYVPGASGARLLWRDHRRRRGKWRATRWKA